MKKNIALMLTVVLSAMSLNAMTAQQIQQQAANAQAQQKKMLQSFKYQFTFVNDYLLASGNQFKIQCSFADGSSSTAYIPGAKYDSSGNIVPSNPLTFPSNACLTGFVVSGSIPAYVSTGSGSASQPFSVSHQNKNICSSTAFRIDPISNDPYVQVNWTVGSNPYLIK